MDFMGDAGNAAQSFNLRIAGCVNVSWLYFDSRNAISAKRCAFGHAIKRAAFYRPNSAANDAGSSQCDALQRGYTHFKFADASLQQGSVVTGTVGSSDTTMSGTYGHGFMNANATTFGSTGVVRAPTATAAATVVMFHANQPEAQGAFDAAQILKQYSM
jgi:hypothetical protein